MSNETTPNGASAPLMRRPATILCADVASYSHMMRTRREVNSPLDFCRLFL